MIQVSAERRQEEQTRDTLIAAVVEGHAARKTSGPEERWSLGEAEMRFDRTAYKAALGSAHEGKGFGDFAVSVHQGAEEIKLGGAAGALVIDALDRRVLIEDRAPDYLPKVPLAA